MSLPDTFAEAVVAGLGGSFAFGMIWIIRMLIKIINGMKHLVPSMQTLYEIQPYLAEAIRHQNSAFKELGANGSTVKSNECLDEVDKILRSKLAHGSVGKVQE